jgi:hypothetical protein
LIATILSSFASSLSASIEIERPVLEGTLYKIIGIFTAFAIAEKCATRPFCVVLL